MPAPSVTVTLGDRGPASPEAGDVGALFAVGLADQGPVGSVTECLSLTAVKATYGDVVAYSHLIRSAEAYFREGGSRMLISRAVGPTPVTATLALSSSAPAVVLNVAAISPGDHGNKYSITVTTTTGSNRTVVLEHDDDGVLSTGTYATTAALQADLEATGRVVTSLGVGTWPLANLAETHLATGTDDHASIVAAQWQTALDVFDAELGVGSVAVPGITTAAMHAALLDHAETNKRFAVLDGIDTATVSSNTTPAGVLRALDVTAGYGQMFVPWVTVPGPGTTSVTIPPSGAVAGRMALADHENEAGPGQPAAGRFGVFRWVDDVTQEWTTQTDRDLFSEAGVTLIRNIRGRVQPYDGLTLADPSTYPQWAEASGVRVALAIYGEAQAALEQYVMAVIDGNRHLLAAIEKDLVGICQGWYGRRALYGATASEAFSVDATSLGVNPLAALALRQVSAQVELRTSPFAATLALLITKVASGDTI